MTDRSVFPSPTVRGATPLHRASVAARVRTRLASAAAWRPDRPGRVVAVIGIGVVAAVAVYLATGLQGSLAYVLPRRLLALGTMLLVGLSLAVAAVIFQTVTTNRILTPSIMGIDALFVLVQTVAVFGAPAIGVGRLPVPVLFAVNVAAMLAFSVVLFTVVFRRAGNDLHRLVLVGIVAGLFFTSLSSFLQMTLNPVAFQVLQDRLFASFGRVQPVLLAATVGCAALGLLLVFRHRHTLDVLHLGRERAISLGVDHRRVTVELLLATAVLTAASTALIGRLVFLGLLAANLAYLLVGERHRHSLPAAAGIGCLTLLVGQTVLSRLLRFSTALGIVIELVGGVVFLILLLRKRFR